MWMSHSLSTLIKSYKMIAFGVRGVFYGKHVPLNRVCAKLASQRQNSIQFHASCLTQQEALYRIFLKAFKILHRFRWCSIECFFELYEEHVYKRIWDTHQYQRIDSLLLFSVFPLYDLRNIFLSLFLVILRNYYHVIILLLIFSISGSNLNCLIVNWFYVY